jgi:Rieske 2Fe-2S family protein
MSNFTAVEKATIQKYIQSRQDGYGLPRPFYHDELVYRADIEAIWRKGWLFAGHSCQIPNPGDYFSYDIDSDSVIIARGDDGFVKAFHNVCRHRGSLICVEPQGHVHRFICPYHQWTYGRDGRLITWRGMQDGLDKSELGLRPVHVQEVEGLIFISLAETPLDFAPAAETIAPQAKPQGFTRAKVAKIMDFDIPANWKLVWENNRECYHCNVNHPQYIKANFDHYNEDDTIERVALQLHAVTTRSEEKWAKMGLAVSHKKTGMTEFPDPENRIWYSANRTPLVDGYVSESMDGKQVAPLMGDYPDPDVGTLRIRMLPNFWNHSSCDHGVSVRLTPAGIYRTQARIIWVVDEKAEEGKDYDLDKLLPFWLLTAEQDWGLCENAQKGVNSRAYVPGPLSRYKEYDVDRFLRWYLKELADGIQP